MKISMIDMITSTAARVKPRSVEDRQSCLSGQAGLPVPHLPILECRAIESVSRSGAVDIVDAGRGELRRVTAGIDRIRIVRIRRLLHFHPISALRDRIFWNRAEVLVRNKRLQAVRI